MKTYVFDIDGTICNNTYGEYEKAVPIVNNINHINLLFSKGNYIKFFTARGSGTGKDWYDFTKKQLEYWGVSYHELIVGKPEGDYYIDDKGINAAQWDWDSEDIVIKDTEVLIKKDLLASLNSIENLINEKICLTQICKVVSAIQESIKKGGKVIFAGNGGSFADSQHLSAEFVSKLCIDRNPLPSLALGTNSSAATAIGNDYGFENLFARELEAIAKPNDIFIGISTSGNSRNIIKAIEKSIDLKLKFFILTGSSGGVCSKYKDHLIRVPSDETLIIQQLHITIGHIICKLSEKEFLK